MHGFVLVLAGCAAFVLLARVADRELEDVQKQTAKTFDASTKKEAIVARQRARLEQLLKGEL